MEEGGLANLLVHQKSNLIITVVNEPIFDLPLVGVAGVGVSGSGGLRPPVLGLEGVELNEHLTAAAEHVVINMT